MVRAGTRRGFEPMLNWSRSRVYWSVRSDAERASSIQKTVGVEESSRDLDDVKLKYVGVVRLSGVRVGGESPLGGLIRWEWRREQTSSGVESVWAVVTGSEAVLGAAVDLLAVVPEGTAIAATFVRGGIDWPQMLADSDVSQISRDGRWISTYFSVQPTYGRPVKTFEYVTQS